jgi:hypothetical protein
VATAHDGCGSVTVGYLDSITNLCGGTKIISRLWTATDLCGNSASCLQTITVRDTAPPTIVCPPSVTLECPAITTTNATGVATAQDGCGAVTVTYSDVVTNNCAQTKVIARLWTATDACGNQASCVQTITVRDTIKPTLFKPADVILECPATATTTNATGAATAQDGCGAVTIAYSDSVATGCGMTKVISRTWTATDTCGNSTSGIQTITVRDTTKPLISCPPDVALECPANTSTNNTGVATASDTCGSVTVRYNDSVATPCGAAKVISRTWTATDACGNSASCVQTITVRDTGSPTITCPPDLTLECGASTAPGATGTATAQDACSVVNVTYSDSVSNICGGSKIIKRTWTASDGCGNSANCVQTIRVIDTTPPDIKSSITICTYSQGGYGGGGYPAQVLINNYVSTFSAGMVLGIYAPTNGNAAPNGLLWQGTSTGLSALQAAISVNGGAGIIGQDAVNPTDTFGAGSLGRQTLALILNVAFNTTGVLGSAPNNYGSLIYTNNGDSLNGLTVSQILALANRAVAGLGFPAGYDASSLASLVNNLNISYEACSKSSWAVSHFLIPPQVITVSCASQIPAPDPSDVIASDTCSSPVSLSVLPDQIIDFGCSNHFTVQRTWVARDACGNTNSYSYFVVVNDTSAVTITCPPSLALECGTDTSAAATGTASARSACGPLNVNYSDIVSNNCGGAKMILRTWTANDGCTNRGSCLQTITIRDTTPPTLTCQPDRTVGAGVPWTFDTPAATDTCSSVTIQVLSTVTNQTPTNLVATRTWVATDACGNSNLCHQTITASLGVAPVIVTQPAGQTVAFSNNFSLRVSATGTGPLSFQWRLNGTNIAGATRTALNLSQVGLAEAGLYNVVVTNTAGMVVSATAVVNVAPKIFASSAGNLLTLTWPSPFILQSSPYVNGPYIDVPGALSPFVRNTSLRANEFFRLRSAPIILQQGSLSAGQFSLKCQGVPGCNFVIQASTNLVNWVNMTTNCSPFTFVDPTAAQHPNCFYRAVLAH